MPLCRHAAETEGFAVDLEAPPPDLVDVTAGALKTDSYASIGPSDIEMGHSALIATCAQ